MKIMTTMVIVLKCFIYSLLKAVENNHLEVVAELVRNGADMNFFHTFMKVNDTKMVAEFIKHGMDIETANYNNRWIETLIDRKEGTIVEYLVKECDIDINQSNSRPTPLQYAAYKPNNSKMIEELIKLGAKVDTKAFHNACQNDSIDNMVVFIKHGCDATAEDIEGRTGLHLAFNDCIIMELMKYPWNGFRGCEPYNRTPLHYAAERGLLEGIKEMIKRGADVNARDRHDRHHCTLHVIRRQHYYYWRMELILIARMKMERHHSGKSVDRDRDRETETNRGRKASEYWH